MNDIVKLIKDLIPKMGLKCVAAPTPARNILYITDNAGNNVHAIYYKVRNSSVGFWGLTDNQLNSLNNLSVDYTVMLISKNFVYTLSKTDIPLIQRNLNLANDGDYKINEKDLSAYNCGVYQL